MSMLAYFLSKFAYHMDTAMILAPLNYADMNYFFLDTKFIKLL